MFHILKAKLASFSSSSSSLSHSANSDIDVSCGAQTIDISILMCPIYFNGYNESMLAFNSEHSKPECHGVADWTVDPPVVRFNFSITEEGINSCSSSLTVSGDTHTLTQKCFFLPTKPLTLLLQRSTKNREQGCFQNSPLLSLSTSLGCSAQRTRTEALSPTTRRWCTGSHAATLYSTLSTIHRWVCKWPFEYWYKCFHYRTWVSVFLWRDLFCQKVIYQ